MAKKSLGRGLEALLESYSEEQEEKRVMTVSVYDIDTNPDQPRKSFDEEKLKELAASLKQHGIVQPLIVKKHDDRFIIVAGERRFRAARMAGIKTVPCILSEAGEEQLQEISLIENIQREDLNPMEEAAAVRFLMDQHDLTQEEVAARLGKSRPAIANTLRLMNLPESIRALIKAGRLTSGHGKVLAGLEDKQKLEELGQKAAEEEWSVKKLEDTVRLLNGARKHKQQPLSKELRQVTAALRNRLGARVTVSGNDEKGRIILHYYSRDDLNNILEGLLSEDDL